VRGCGDGLVMVWGWLCYSGSIFGCLVEAGTGVFSVSMLDMSDQSLV